MSNPVLELPELKSLGYRSNLIRIPDQIDVPVTPRVTRLIDSSIFRRLAGISQLGLVSLVYPGATHSRLEHSLGVFRNSLLFLGQLAQSPGFRNIVSVEQAKTLLVGSLLHDIGHWPFCHPIEDLEIEAIPPHESIATEHICQGELAKLIREDWEIEPRQVADLVSGNFKNQGAAGDRIISSILSGPIDVDKMDYLYRDSLHCGVPYGRNFDSLRLISSLSLNESRNGIALTSKGKTAAEMMVFARYVMFSEVYWHHTVRSATAMFQRAFYNWYAGASESNKKTFMFMSELELIARIRGDRQTESQLDLVEGLFGIKRRLFKRLAEFSFSNNPKIYDQLARKPYPELVEESKKLATAIADAIGEPVDANEVLVDAPPQGLEVQFKVQMFDRATSEFKDMAEASPVIQALATNQFDNFVKKLRIFVHPRLVESKGLRERIRTIDLSELLVG